MVTIPFKSFAKAFAALLAFAAALSACEPFETISGTPRSQTEHPAEEEIRESNLDEHVDTVIYLAALEFEEGYDWSKDTVLRDVPATSRQENHLPGHAVSGRTGLQSGPPFLRQRTPL